LQKHVSRADEIAAVELMRAGSKEERMESRGLIGPAVEALVRSRQRISVRRNWRLTLEEFLEML